MIDFLQANPYELPGNVRLQFTPTTGNAVRVWVIDAPTASKLKSLLAADTQNNRVQVFEGGAADTWEAELDKGGAYVFVLQEYQQGSAGFTGGYDGDPRGGHTALTKVGAEVERTVYIGERLSMLLGTGSHGNAKLVMWVWNDTIRQTTVALHGETTPAIRDISAATTTRLASKRRAETAALDATVQASIAALIDLPVAGLLPNVATLVAEMTVKLPKHFTNDGGAYHGAADTMNNVEIGDLPTDPGAPEGFARVAVVLSNRLKAHMANEADGAAEYHTEPDYTNVIIANPPPPGSSRMPEVWASIADVYRAYEDHRRNATVHTMVDGDNTLDTPLDPLLVVHRDFLAAMQPLTPAAPATTNPGVTQAAQLGFELEPRPGR